MVSIKTTTALIMVVSSILSVAPIAAVAQPFTSNFGIIDDRDTNTQVNSATQTQVQGDGDSNNQVAAAFQSNYLEDNDVNVITQVIE